MKDWLIRLFFAFPFVVFFVVQASAFTCDDVHRAQETWSPAAIKLAAAVATPAQKQQAADCLKSAQQGATPAKKVVHLKHAKVKKPKAAPMQPAVEPHNPVTHSSVRINLQTSNPPVAVSPTAAEPQETSMPTWIVPFLAVFGALAFTFFVGKYGLLPVINKFVSWFNSGKADFLALEARVKMLENKTSLLFPGAQTTAAPPAPSVAAGVTGPAPGG